MLNPNLTFPQEPQVINEMDFNAYLTLQKKYVVYDILEGILENQSLSTSYEGELFTMVYNISGESPFNSMAFRHYMVSIVYFFLYF